MLSCCQPLSYQSLQDRTPTTIFTLMGTVLKLFPTFFVRVSSYPNRNTKHKHIFARYVNLILYQTVQVLK